MFHFTNTAGYNGVRSQPDWRFVAAQPPTDHPVGAYFTTLPPDAKHLATRLRIPREKLEYVFEFSGTDGLLPIRGDRGRFVLYAPEDYIVSRDRQRFHGRSEEWTSADTTSF